MKTLLPNYIMNIKNVGINIKLNRVRGFIFGSLIILQCVMILVYINIFGIFNVLINVKYPQIHIPIYQNHLGDGKQIDVLDYSKKNRDGVTILESLSNDPMIYIYINNYGLQFKDVKSLSINLTEKPISAAECYVFPSGLYLHKEFKKNLEEYRVCFDFQKEEYSENDNVIRLDLANEIGEKLSIDSIVINEYNFLINEYHPILKMIIVMLSILNLLVLLSFGRVRRGLINNSKRIEKIICLLLILVALDIGNITSKLCNYYYPEKIFTYDEISTKSNCDYINIEAKEGKIIPTSRNPMIIILLDEMGMSGDKTYSIDVYVSSEMDEKPTIYSIYSNIMLDVGTYNDGMSRTYYTKKGPNDIALRIDITYSNMDNIPLERIVLNDTKVLMSRLRRILALVVISIVGNRIMRNIVERKRA